MSQLIMVTANNPTLLDAYRTFLTAEGYYVYTQPDFKAAFLAALEIEPRLIITDVLMDDAEEALDLIAQLRQKDSPFATVPVILSSTQNKLTWSVETQIRQDGNIRLIPKPFDTKSLTTEIEAVLAS